MAHDPARYATTTVVSTPAEAADALTLARQRNITIVGLGLACVAASGRGRSRATMRPLLGLALAEPVGTDLTVYPFVIDFADRNLCDVGGELLGLPAVYVAHDLPRVLLALWEWGLTEPAQVWDTRVAEAAFQLGLHHPRYDQAPQATPAWRRRHAGERRDAALTPDVLALKYGIDQHPGAATGQPYGRAAAAAVLAARVYPRQAQAAALQGCLDHLVGTEMPWVVTTARASSHGVRLDRAACDRVTAAAIHHQATLTKALADHGITDPDDDRQLEAFFARCELLDAFKTHDGYEFDGNRLDAVRDRHPAVPLVRAARRINSLMSQQILTTRWEGRDGRVHPVYSVLGAHSGRLTCHDPNVLGLGKVFRPLVVPDPGRGIGEADYAQIEVGIAAAVYRDPDLVRIFNSEDVYSAMAREFFAAELPPDARDLSPAAFKEKYPAHRAKMKVCTLGVIYGLSTRGLAIRLGVTEARAETFLKRFFGLFPALRRALEDGPRNAELRGCVADASGLRRRRPAAGRLSPWERNWVRNQPVQGTAAAVFKDAGNRLDRLYADYDAWLIIPLHDAFVFEAPLGVLDEVAAVTERVMCEAVRERFPGLRPRVEVNISRPGCWNKDGHADSVERWVEDPLFAL